MTQQDFLAPRLGTPPRQSAIARFVGFARGFAMPTVGLGLLILGAEKVCMPEYKPSQLIGKFVGSVENAETLTKQPVAVDFARLMAEASAQAQANAAMEIEINRQEQQKIADSLSMQAGLANLADLACILGQFVPANASPDWQNAGAVARNGCGAGSQLRANMVREQVQAGRQGGSIQPREVRSVAQPAQGFNFTPAAQRDRYEPPELAAQRSRYGGEEQPATPVYNVPRYYAR